MTNNGETLSQVNGNGRLDALLTDAVYNPDTKWRGSKQVVKSLVGGSVSFQIPANSDRVFEVRLDGDNRASIPLQLVGPPEKWQDYNVYPVARTLAIESLPDEENYLVVHPDPNVLGAELLTFWSESPSQPQ